MSKVLAGVGVGVGVVTFVIVAIQVAHVAVDASILTCGAPSNATGFEPPPATMILDPFAVLIPSEETRAISITSVNNILATSTEAIVKTEWIKKSGDSFIDFGFR
jgi:hypothetical protein